MNVRCDCLKEGRLTIFLEGALDSTNAAEADKVLTDLVRQYPEAAVILDAEELNYVSSSGLRVILKLKKERNSTSIINVNSSVYEVLEMTGFVDLLEVKKALRRIEIDQCEVLGQGGQGKVVRIDKDTIVKLYHSGSPLEDVERERAYAKNAFVMGIPTAIPFDVVKCDDQYGLVFELINSDTLANYLTAHPEQVEEYGVRYGKLLKDLHQIQSTDQVLSDCHQLYHNRLEKLGQYLTEEEVKLLHRINDAIPRGNCVIHGDFHPGNIMIQDDELIFIDMADLTYGHPLYDLGSMALTHHITNDERIAITTHMDAAAVRKLWSIFLKVYLDTEDPKVIELTVKKASVVGLMKMASALSFSHEINNPAVLNGIISIVRKNLLEHAEELIQLLQM